VCDCDLQFVECDLTWEAGCCIFDIFCNFGATHICDCCCVFNFCFCCWFDWHLEDFERVENVCILDCDWCDCC
jgi:hypothetical protein